ncbi:MAG: phenylacetate-CoA oxygenase subunit PaaI [Acidobacteria bacterium]|nr:MAG: phenylacetate-CoA oxygenase subunit PaaI [Acidobacteriota bacterium]
MSARDTGTAALAAYLIRLGDDRLVLGHRLSEWCGHGPILEEDIALTNIALDLIGQAQALLTLGGEAEGKGRSADDLAYFRDEIDFTNCLLVEQPNGDFAQTIARQFFFDAFDHLLASALESSSHRPLAGVAAKARLEAAYHLRHSREWMLRLGGGTEESHRRLQRAVGELWRFTGELFESDDIDRELQAAGIAPDPAPIRKAWEETVSGVLREAGIDVPADEPMRSGGRRGRHTEHLGHMLAEMQIVARSHPGARW